MVNQDKVFAIFNVTGTPNYEAILPLVKQIGVPFFSPFTGADSLRNPPLPIVFNVGASYREETEKLVQHLQIMGIQRVLVVHQASSFGKYGLVCVEAAMSQRGLAKGLDRLQNTSNSPSSEPAESSSNKSLSRPAGQPATIRPI